MNTSILATAAGLSDQDLLDRLSRLAAREREASVELITHLAVLDVRPSVYAAQGFGSLFSYCTQALRLSEDAACNRIEAARACRRFPVVLDLLSSGAMSLTGVRMIARQLTTENHEAVLARASGRSLRDIEALIAELAPRPDVPSAVRKVPAREMPSFAAKAPEAPGIAASSVSPASPQAIGAPIEQLAIPPTVFTSTPRAVIRATAPERYRVQFTIGPESHEKLRRVQALLRREIPDGDPGAIFERALALLLERVEKTKVAASAHRSAAQGGGEPARRSEAIRRTTDNVSASAPPSRHVPREVRRVVWRRDAGQCAFIAVGGHRCTERIFLEFHHIQPYANHGPATVANIALRCRRHNQYEAERDFGPRVLERSKRSV